MSKINYLGSFLIQLEEAFEKNPDMQIGEVLFSAFHKSNMNNKHFFYATDEEMYTALERFNKFGQDEEDEPLTEQAFSFWVEQKNIIKK